MKNKNIMKKQQKKISDEKVVYSDIINYLINSFYYDCNKKIKMNEIKNKLCIKDDKLLIKFINFLGQEKYIKYTNKSKKEFTIEFKGLIYLENLKLNYNQYENNLIGSITAIIALMISQYVIIYVKSDTLKAIFSIALIIILGKFINDILNKKYTR